MIRTLRITAIASIKVETSTLTATLSSAVVEAAWTPLMVSWSISVRCPHTSLANAKSILEVSTATKENRFSPSAGEQASMSELTYAVVVRLDLRLLLDEESCHFLDGGTFGSGDGGGGI